MGGINTNKGPRPIKGNITALTQELTLNIFEGTSKFYAAHAALERAVIDQTNERKAKTTLVKKIVSGIDGANKSFSDAASLLLESKELIIEEGTWHAPYMEMLYSHCSSLGKKGSAIAKAIGAKSFEKAYFDGPLQETLWGNGKNAKVRQESLAFLDELNELLAAHSSFVKITNQPKAKFIRSS